MLSYNILKNRILFQKYKIIRKIGKGSFGYVFKGVNLQDNSEVAIKAEKKSSIYHLLEAECNFLSILKGYGIPEVKSYGYSNNFYFLVEELLGKNLTEVRESIKAFSLKDIVMIAIQSLERIEFIHSRYVIHRDIKPENFLLGYNNSSKIYLIDFGMARKYKSSRTGKHLKYSLTGKLFGTFKYLSYNGSRGVEQSRRDDLESIGYMLVYLRNGYLPWKGLNLKGNNVKKKYFDSLKLKRNISPEDLCKNLPQEFADYIKYCRNLGFEDAPNYNYLSNLFKGLLIKMKENNDSNFTWNKKLNVFWKKKSKEDRRQNPNIFKRKESPQQRLYRSIKKSFNSKEKIRKAMELKADLSFIKKQNSKVKSEELLEVSNNLDENDFNDDENISFNSNYAQFNMNLADIENSCNIDEKNTNQKKNLIKKINTQKQHKIYEFQSRNTRKNYNITEYNKRKINNDNKKNFKNIKIIINQNMSNSSRNITNNFTKVINTSNNELNSFNKKGIKKISLMDYKTINRNPTNIYKKSSIFLLKPSLYKSRVKNLSINTQGNDTKSELIKRIKVSEYKPMYNLKQKFEILYSNKDNNSNQIIKSQRYFNSFNELKDMNNNEKIIAIKKRKNFPYHNSYNNILKNINIYNISNNIRNPNLVKSFRNLNKSASFKNDNNEKNCLLKSQNILKEKYYVNNLYGSKNDIRSFRIPQRNLVFNVEELKVLYKNNSKINPIKRNIYFAKKNKF